MLQFVLGVIMGGFVGFFVCSICSILGTNRKTEPPREKESGEDIAKRK
jgi:hypothetical protein